MRFKLICMAVVTLLAFSLQLSAENGQPKHHHYKLIDLGTFGGPQSYLYIPANYASVLNNRGTVVGWGDTEAQDPFSPNFCFNFDCYASPAFQSWNGTITDLGTLPGGTSSAAGWISPNGLIAGWSENGTTDPSFPGFPVTHGVVWKDGAMTDLDTLADGYQSVALAVNSSGLVVGAADNSIADANPMLGEYYGWATQTRAFLWQDGVMKDLGTLGGTDAAAFLINERGQVVGVSYTSSAPSAYCANQGSSLTTGTFLYEGGEMKNLGGFGGTCTFPGDLNDRGEIVGISTLPGDEYQHAFLWKDDSLHDLHNTIGGNNAAALALNNNGEAAGFASLTGDQAVHASLWTNRSMTDLGTLGEDPCSAGFSINAPGQVVGVSGYQFDLPGCNSGNSNRAFLWEGGPMVDLNTLIPPQSSLYLVTPETINDRGEIAGVGVDASGYQHAFLLVPCDDDDSSCQDGAAGPAFRSAPVMTKPTDNQNNTIRRMPHRRLERVPVPQASSEPSAPGIDSNAAEGGATTTNDSMLNSLPSSDDPIFRLATAASCTREGFPCGFHGPCCPGLKCVFSGGTTRAGFKCEPKSVNVVSERQHHYPRDFFRGGPSRNISGY